MATPSICFLGTSSHQPPEIKPSKRSRKTARFARTVPIGWHIPHMRSLVDGPLVRSASDLMVGLRYDPKLRWPLRRCSFNLAPVNRMPLCIFAVHKKYRYYQTKNNKRCKVSERKYKTRFTCPISSSLSSSSLIYDLITSLSHLIQFHFFAIFCLYILTELKRKEGRKKGR